MDTANLILYAVVIVLLLSTAAVTGYYNREMRRNGMEFHGVIGNDDMRRKAPIYLIPGIVVILAAVVYCVMDAWDWMLILSALAIAVALWVMLFYLVDMRRTIEAGTRKA